MLALGIRREVFLTIPHYLGLLNIISQTELIALAVKTWLRRLGTDAGKSQLCLQKKTVNLSSVELPLSAGTQHGIRVGCLAA